MEAGRLREPREVEVARLAVAVVELLGGDMEDVVLELLERAGDDLTGPTRRRASVADRIARLCRRLTQEVRRYEHLRLWEMDPLTEEDDVPF